MHKKSTTVFVFIFLLIVSIFIWSLGRISFLQPISGITTFFSSPLQHMVFALFHLGGESAQLQQVKMENAALLKKLVDQQKILAEDNALRDQFKTNKPSNGKLIPANVIGAPGLIPGVSQPDSLIIDVGSKQGISVGEVVVANDTLIGRVAKVSYSIAVILPIQATQTPFTARSLQTNAVGLISPLDSGGLQFGNVLLSDTLQKGDLVVTKGDVTADGKGIPPDLVIGKIVSIDKKPSDLFQTAKVLPLIDLTTIRTVFLVSY